MKNYLKNTHNYTTKHALSITTANKHSRNTLVIQNYDACCPCFGDVNNQLRDSLVMYFERANP